MNHIPANSLINQLLDNAYYADSFSTVIPYHNESALELFFTITQNTPAWIDMLMSLRNKIVSKMGLKHLGQFGDVDITRPSTDYCIGERVGIFTLYANEKNEAILEDRDKHLNVKISLYVVPNGDTATVYASTVVHIKNTLGKLYMLFVTPMHKMIVPTSLKALSS